MFRTLDSCCLQQYLALQSYCVASEDEITHTLGFYCSILTWFGINSSTLTNFERIKMTLLNQFTDFMPAMFMPHQSIYHNPMITVSVEM